jgi:hypothetical protein
MRHSAVLLGLALFTSTLTLGQAKTPDTHRGLKWARGTFIFYIFPAGVVPEAAPELPFQNQTKFVY